MPNSCIPRIVLIEFFAKVTQNRVSSNSCLILFTEQEPIIVIFVLLTVLRSLVMHSNKALVADIYESVWEANWTLNRKCNNTTCEDETRSAPFCKIYGVVNIASSGNRVQIWGWAKWESVVVCPESGVAAGFSWMFLLLHYNVFTGFLISLF